MSAKDVPVQTLGEWTHSFRQRLQAGSPPDRCVMCGSTTALLHPVEKTWACSRCHTTPKGPVSDES